MTRYFSDDRTRMIDDAPALAIAAYKVKQIGDSYEAGHVGIFEDGEDAMNWLKYGTPNPVKITVRQVR